MLPLKGLCLMCRTLYMYRSMVRTTESLKRTAYHEGCALIIVNCTCTGRW